MSCRDVALSIATAGGLDSRGAEQVDPAAARVAGGRAIRR
jgi:hypothetical protein